MLIIWFRSVNPGREKQSDDERWNGRDRTCQWRIIILYGRQPREIYVKAKGLELLEREDP